MVFVFTSEARPMTRLASNGQLVRDVMTFHAVTVMPSTCSSPRTWPPCRS